jgi:hypothetical protein
MNDFVTIANRVRGAVTATTTLILLYVLYVSRDHITHIAHWIGLGGYQAATLFILIDLPAVIGRVLQTRYFANSTKRVGRRLTYSSGALSLACNVGSGIITGSPGVAGYGAFIVVMFMVLESVVTKIKPAAAVTRAKNAATEAKPSAPALTPRQIAARKGAETKRRKAIAPVSPATVAEIDSIIA